MKILNFGSLNIDRVYRVAHLVRAGETISSLGYQCFPGGKGLNQSIAAARAGQKVYHAGCIGADGGFLLDTLQEGGVDTRYVRNTGGITGHALIQVDDGGENCIILYPGSNFENEEAYVDQVLSDFEGPDILLLQNEINDLEMLLKKGKERGMRIMLNPSPMDEALKRMDLSAVTWLMVNETEGSELTGETSPDRITDVLLQKYPDMRVVLTLGGKGAVYRDGREYLNQPSFPVTPVDTTAAGDTFTGYFIAAVAEGKETAEALRLAAMAAAMAVAGQGASVSIPKREQVEQKLCGLPE